MTEFITLSSPSNDCLRETNESSRRVGLRVSCRPASMKDLLRPHLSSRFALHTVAVTKKSISIKRWARFWSTPGELLALPLSGAVLATDGGGVASASSKISTKKSTASGHAFGRRATARGHRSSLRRPTATPPRPRSRREARPVPYRPQQMRTSRDSDEHRFFSLHYFYLRRTFECLTKTPKSNRKDNS
jgi:hypothetical protein